MKTALQRVGFAAFLLGVAGCAGADPAVAGEETPGLETQVVSGPPHGGLLDGGVGILTSRGKAGRPVCTTCTTGPARIDMAEDLAHR